MHLTINLLSNTLAERILPSELFFEVISSNESDVVCGRSTLCLMRNFCCLIYVPAWILSPCARLACGTLQGVTLGEVKHRWASAVPDHSKGLWADSNFYKDSQHSPEPLILSNPATFWRLSQEHSWGEIKAILLYCVSQVSFFPSASGESKPQTKRKHGYLTACSLLKEAACLENKF